jgi:hypothetical protein
MEGLVWIRPAKVMRAKDDKYPFWKKEPDLCYTVRDMIVWAITRQGNTMAHQLRAIS